MQIIIPMSGSGDRFLRAGYLDPKPLIEVDGHPIIKHVVDLFPGEKNFIFICNSFHLQQTPMREILESIAPSCKIVSMEPRKLGPVYSVMQAERLISDHEPTIVNYCDFSVLWDYDHFKREVFRLRCDGCITAYRGFHPHSLGNTYYAYMRTDSKNRMLEIREKESFTSDRMQEFASAGTYYFSKGSLVKKYFKQLIERKIDKGGEYYASLVYNLMNYDGLYTHVYELEKFLQWGTPGDLEEYKWWSEAFALKTQKNMGLKFDGMQVVAPMAGAGARFAAHGYADIKPLVSVSGKPMFVQALRSVPLSANVVLLVQKKELGKIRPHAERYFPGCTIVPTEGLTQGQASTMLLSKPHLDVSLPLFIAPCDTGFIWDYARFSRIVSDPSVDCCVWAFTNYMPAARNPTAYGWLKMGKGDRIEAVSCKSPVSHKPLHDLGVTGAFYFRKAGFFFEAAEEMVRKNRRINGEFYVDDCINDVILAGRKTTAFVVSKYLCWGTPNELRTYEYWQDYFNKNKSHSYKKSVDSDYS